MCEERGKYPSLILPGDALGADVLLLGSRLPTSAATSSSLRKRWLLVKIQAKAKDTTDMSNARASLELPYGINRDANVKKASLLETVKKAKKVVEETKEAVEKVDKAAEDEVVAAALKRTERAERAAEAAKKASDAKMAAFRQIEKECEVVHVICVMDKREEITRVRTAHGQTFVEIVIDSTKWESEAILSPMKKGIENIRIFKSSKRG